MIKITAKIVTVQDTFAFASEVKRGWETVETNGDVFILGQGWVEGQIIECDELEEDPQRDGMFRAKNPKPYNQVEALDTKEGRSTALAHYVEPNKYHSGRAKVISATECQKVVSNDPLDKVLRFSESYLMNDPEKFLSDGVSFIEKTFSDLILLGFSSEISDGKMSPTDEILFEDTFESYKNADAQGLADQLQDNYNKLKLAKRMIYEVSQKGGKVSSVFHSGLAEIPKLKIGEVEELTTSINTSLELLEKKELVEMVMPISNLPEMLMASPVWFHWDKEGFKDEADNEDPAPDDIVQYFSDQIGTKQFAWLYQMYNRRSRPISKYQGDLMPSHIIEKLNSAKDEFDTVVIMTPYHDIASQEWADPEWQRNIDPFLVGFKKGIPYMFLLGRWSATGLFPLFVDMIADTINHIQNTKSLLKNFPEDSYWYMGGDYDSEGDNPEETKNDHCLGDGLPDFADKLIENFNNGTLFSWLRGEQLQISSQEQDSTM